MDDLIEQKTKIVLNLIRTNSTADDVLKITQGFRNIVDGWNDLKEPKPTKNKGASA